MLPSWMLPFSYSIRSDVPMSQICWFRTGGRARYLFKPSSLEHLQAFIKAKPKDFMLFTLGVGSNILIRDGGIDGCVLRLGREFNYIKAEESKIIAGAATLDLHVALYAAQHCRAGLEFLSGIPGTIGGALAMNAGAYGCDVSGVLDSAVVMNSNGEITTISVNDCGYHYRGHSLDSDVIFIEARFNTTFQDAGIIESRIMEIQKTREQTQPIKSKTSGSTFKNPPGTSAWRLIEDAGCRGMRIGGAVVSNKHCNFFINENNASADDIERLIHEVQNKVLGLTGILLEPEIKIIGDINRSD